MADDPMSSSRQGEAEVINAESSWLETEITRALEIAPTYVVPSNFAARVAERAASGRKLQVSRSIRVPLTVQHYGRNAAIASLCVLLAMIFLLAHRLTGSSHLWMFAEVLFCVQFALVAVWLVTRDLRSFFSWTSQG